MKLSLVAFGVAQAALVAAQAPYNAEYNRYCGGGKRHGTVSAGGVDFSYECDNWWAVSSSTFVTKEAGQCANVCSYDDDCDAAVWDSNTGNCALGKTSGAGSYRPGVVTMKKPDALASCLAKYKPIDHPSCPSSDRRVAEVGTQRWYIACNRVSQGMDKQLSGNYDTLEDCIKACQNRGSRCSYAQYNTVLKACWPSGKDVLLNSVTARNDFVLAFDVTY